MKILKVIAIALTIIIAIMFIKFKPAYAVSLNGEKLGYVGDEEDFNNNINENLLTSSEENVAFVELENVNYSFSLVSRNEVNEEEVLAKLEDNVKNIYRVYEIADLNNEENKIYVNTMDEAESIVNTMKETYSEIEPNLVINTIYLENVDEVNEESIKLAKTAMEEKLKEQLEEKEEKDSRTVNGIYLACIPTSGRISSRFGANESILGCSFEDNTRATP